jgi:hypothetical protein
MPVWGHLKTKLLMQLVSLTTARRSVLIPVNSGAGGYATLKLHLFDIALSLCCGTDSREVASRVGLNARQRDALRATHARKRSVSERYVVLRRLVGPELSVC